MRVQDEKKLLTPMTKIFRTVSCRDRLFFRILCRIMEGWLHKTELTSSCRKGARRVERQ
jgi:hypothetical protein